MSGGGFPQHAVLGSMDRGTFVRCTADGSIRTGGTDILSPHCKFELERAETREKCFNIRSCYNNKYLEVAEQDSYRLNATAAKPRESPLDWKCTLFCIEGEYMSSMSICYVSQSTYVKRQDDSFSAGDFGGYVEWFKITDWQSLVKFPKHVTFKTYYGEYLEAQWIEGHEYHKFDSKDPRNPRVAYEIFPTGYGGVRIKSNYFKKFWRRSPDWIWADSSENTTNDIGTIFQPLKFGKDNSSIALRTLGNNKFCVPLSKDWKEKCLNANEDSVTREAIFTMEEAVLSREIFNVRYRLMHSRIYNENILTMVTRDVLNSSSVPETVSVKLAYTQSSTKTWERGVSASLTVSTTINAGIPLIAEGKVEVSGTIGGDMKWGDTVESSKLVETTETVIAAPRTLLKTSLLATEAKCDVPFSYTQRDVLLDGRVVYYDMDDGLFTGVNTYNFRIETAEKKL